MNKKLNLFRIILWTFITFFLITYFVKLISGEKVGFDFPQITWSDEGSIVGDYKQVCEKIDNMDGINSIEVSLTSQEVNIINTDDENIKVVQYSTIELDEDKYVNLQKDGDKIKISVPNRNIIYIGNFGLGGQIQKFDIYIPDKYNNKLSIVHTSGKCNIDNLTLSELKLKNTSGKIEANNIKVDNLNSKVTSGKIEAQGEFKDIEVNVTSGKAEIECVKVPENLSVEVTSGKCELSLPENEGFNLKYKKSSGSIKSDFELDDFDSSNKSGLAKYKAGGNEWYVKVTSGSVELNEN